MKSFILAIGAAQKMWPHGDEPAFTLIPNYFISGIAAMIVGLMIIVWSLFLLRRSTGQRFFCFFLLEGVSHKSSFFRSSGWYQLGSTTPLTWLRKVLPVKIPEALGKLWFSCLVVGSTLLIFALEIAISGFVPWVKDPETVLSVMVFVSLHLLFCFH